MSELYNRIKQLCDERGVKPTAVATKSGVSPSLLSDIKHGRKQTMTLPTAQKIANYFDVSVDYLLGRTNEKAPTPEGERKISDDDMKFALWGNNENIDDEDLEDVKRYAEFVRQRKKDKRK